MFPIIVSTLMLLVAGSAFADGYPEPQSTEETKLLPPYKMEAPKPVLTKASIDARVKTLDPCRPPLRPVNKTKQAAVKLPPEKFWAGVSLIAGSGSYFGATADGGWYPSFARNYSLNLGIGAVHVTSSNFFREDDELNRLYGRVSLMRSQKIGKREVKLGAFHGRIGRLWKNTDRRTGISGSITLRKFQFGADLGYNSVHEGYTDHGFAAGMNIAYLWR